MIMVAFPVVPRRIRGWYRSECHWNRSKHPTCRNRSLGKERKWNPWLLTLHQMVSWWLICWFFCLCSTILRSTDRLIDWLIDWLPNWLVVCILVFLAAQKDPSIPSPSPSTASMKAPFIPASTPPPVTTKTLQINARRSPAQVRISSLADATPNRYREIAIHQPGPAPISSTVHTSHDELLQEILIVQEAIVSLQEETKVVQLQSTFTPDELAMISEKQRVLQEHIQRQIGLTQQLLALQSEQTSTPEATESKWGFEWLIDWLLNSLSFNVFVFFYHSISLFSR